MLYKVEQLCLHLRLMLHLTTPLRDATTLLHWLASSCLDVDSTHLRPLIKGSRSLPPHGLEISIKPKSPDAEYQMEISAEGNTL